MKKIEVYWTVSGIKTALNNQSIWVVKRTIFPRMYPNWISILVYQMINKFNQQVNFKVNALQVSFELLGSVNMKTGVI